jgi:hypothetical protein
MLIMLHLLGKTYSRPPSQWIIPTSNFSTPSEQALALDLDAACMTIGLDFELQMQKRAR